MSKVPYTINVDRFICTELEEIRKMITTHDFSALAATVERIQHHGSAMEEALYRYQGVKYGLVQAVKDKEVSDEAFRKKVKDVLKKLKK